MAFKVVVTDKERVNGVGFPVQTVNTIEALFSEAGCLTLGLTHPTKVIGNG